MRILVFGYDRDEVPWADVIFDCRRLNNPDRHPQYRQLTGKSLEIQAYVRDSKGFEALWADLIGRVQPWGEEVVVALGCAFGKHRSRAVAHMLARHAREFWGWEVEPIQPYVFLDGREET